MKYAPQLASVIFLGIITLAAAQITEANANAQAIRLTSVLPLLALGAACVAVAGFMAVSPVVVAVLFLRTRPGKLIEKRVIYFEEPPPDWKRPVERQVIYLDRLRQEGWKMADRVGQKKFLER